MDLLDYLFITSCQVGRKASGAGREEVPGKNYLRNFSIGGLGLKVKAFPVCAEVQYD